MSRIGNAPITIPAGIKVKITDTGIEVEGPKGKLSERTQPNTRIKMDGDIITVQRDGDAGPIRARHGLMRALIANAISGAEKGFKKELEIVGVGYRGEVQGQKVNLSLGYSHPVIFDVPADIQVEIDKQNKITVSGASKQVVGQVAAKIRELRKPDAYKGKGIRYLGEYVRIKEGKASGS